MSPALNQILAERQRDAMVAFYLAKVMPLNRSNHAPVTADHLYTHWLLDPHVSPVVTTTRIACAIASVQQYLHNLLQGLEPGYETRGPSAADEAQWRDRLQSYSLWRAHQQVHNDPVSFLDPALRQGKSASFKQLEQDLNQTQLQADDVLSAVQAYLNRFEELANLKTLNGYIDGDNDHLTRSVYYFVGKSSSENSYYWRSLDMRERASVGDAQHHRPCPTAWSDWQKIPLSISEDVPEHTIRPVLFNGRLFVIWAQCLRPVSSFADTVAFETQADDESTQAYQQRLEQRLKSHYLQLRLNYSYKKFDGSWSVPQACIQEYCVMKALYDLNQDNLKNAIRTIAALNAQTTPPTLFLSLSAGLNHHSPSSAAPSTALFLEAARLDQHLTVQTLFSKGGPWARAFDDADAKLTERCWALFCQHNHTNFQFMLPQTGQQHVSPISHQAPHTGTRQWDFEGTQARVLELDPKTGVLLNVTTSQLEVNVRLAQEFTHHRTVIFENGQSSTRLKITLSTSEPNTLGSLTLDAHSSIEFHAPFLLALPDNLIKLKVLCNRTNIIYEDFIRRESATPYLAWPAASQGNRPSDGIVLSLDQANVDAEAFDYYFNNRHCDYTVTLSVYDLSCTRLLNTVVIDTLRTTQRQRMYRPVVMHPLNADNPIPSSPNRANTFLVGMAERSRRVLHASERELGAAHTHRAQIDLNPDTLRPLGELGQGRTSTLTLIYGVLILEADVYHTDVVVLGYALKAATFSLDLRQNKPAIPEAPGIRRYLSNAQGSAEFIQFSATSVEPGSRTLSAIRTNTSIAYLLAKHANVSLSALFDMPLSTWREPPLGDGQPSSALDFHGAHGKSYWELFVYLPWLLAHRLDQEQQHEQAHTWVRYLFDPLRKADPPTGLPAHWRVPALVPDKADPSYAALLPHDPHQLALSKPVYLRQALYLLYVDILHNAGDSAYRQMTRDGLNEAKLWYVRAKNLLGPRPPINAVEPWTQRTLASLAQDQKPASALSPDSTYGCRTVSATLLARWDRIESRLHNLRHHLDLSGKPLNLPLYAALLAPHTLVAAYAQGLATNGPRALLKRAHVGHYRFQVVLGHALRAVDNLSQLGAALLALYERKEQAHFLETQQFQALNLAAIAIEQQTQAMHMDLKAQHALQAGRQLVEDRQRFYQTLLRQGISSSEAQAGQRLQDAGKWDAAAFAAQAGSGLAMLLPNIFGTSNGGIRYEGAFVALQAAAQGVANEQRVTAQHLDRAEQFGRRAQEWTHALEQARLELAHVDAQLAAFSQQQEQTRLQLHLAQTTLEQTRTLYEVLGKRFAKEQLYDWLKTQLTSVYNQAYDATLTLCLNAEASWRHERAQWHKTFIHSSPWNPQCRGLSAGETLKANLLAMDSAYIDLDERSLEITKTFSLRHLHDQDPLSTYDQNWPTMKAALVSGGTLRFELTRALFDEDYPNHYLRRIKSVSVSLPTTLGPYEDIRAILSQTAHSTWLSPGEGDDANNVLKDLRVRQEVALSSGLNDSGLFTLNFEQDERYLPFEYTGAVSSWQLSFPNPTRQADVLEALTDIIVHLRYTAKNGGGLS